MGAVPDAVGDVGFVGEVLRLRDVLEGGVGGVVTGVEHGDRDTGSGQPLLPRLRSPDLLDTPVQGEGPLAVQPDLRLACGQ
ncbi:hypothetical protein GCM10009850_102780 [Nonomuraea monospora]|uniref:Uncharacterized protein n=1 Tax=Nonomuraea monospora TaxID=568818 RepID=A0ABN3CZ48_9ACTN